MRGDLLWVYEGLTQYLGWVLAARSQLVTADLDRQFLALAAANLDNRAGREWRSLADTAISAQRLYDARPDWESMRRGVDFYDEGVLIWLEVDTTIRKQSHGKKSLDDFCRGFFGLPDGPPVVKPYTLESLAEALNTIAEYDWKAFFETRVNRIATDRAPLGGVETGGYHLTYLDHIPEGPASEGIRPNIGVAYSIGLRLNGDGTIIDVLPEMAAAQAGIGPGMRVVTVNGQEYSGERLREDIRKTKNGASLELGVRNYRSTSNYKLNYHDGEKVPVLQRNAEATLIDDILKPLTR
jgi:predicted metalloprotease with PDZ domain